MFENLIFEEKGKVGYITLNRPEVVNALSMKLSDELLEAIELVRKSLTLTVLIIKGAGDHFCAGDDITEMFEWGNADTGTRRTRQYQLMANQLEELDKITIAAVDGLAVGGGLEITMACDFVIASERSQWGMPEVDLGITPGWGGTTRMSHLIGRRLAKEINIIGAIHPAQKAVDYHLWNRVVPDDQFDAEVERMVEMLLAKNQQTLRQLKYIINRGVECDLYTAQGFEILSASLSRALNGMWQVDDADQGAGLRAFMEKGELWQKRRGLAKDFWVD